MSTEVTQYSRCGGLINVGEDVQKLASPAFPKYYPQNQNCKYMIRFDPENSNADDLLYLKFLSFKQELLKLKKINKNARISNLPTIPEVAFW